MAWFRGLCGVFRGFRSSEFEVAGTIAVFPTNTPGRVKNDLSAFLQADEDLAGVFKNLQPVVRLRKRCHVAE